MGILNDNNIYYDNVGGVKINNPDAENVLEKLYVDENKQLLSKNNKVEKEKKTRSLPDDNEEEATIVKTETVRDVEAKDDKTQLKDSTTNPPFFNFGEYTIFWIIFVVILILSLGVFLFYRFYNRKEKKTSSKLSNFIPRSNKTSKTIYDASD